MSYLSVRWPQFQNQHYDVKEAVRFGAFFAFLTASSTLGFSADSY